MDLHKLSVPRLPLVGNFCNQMLREIDQTSRWSIAHVVMNPEAVSTLHIHNHMTEVYVITKGIGELTIGKRESLVRAGSVIEIPPGKPHKLLNAGATRLEHFVFAFPPFDTKDVHEVNDTGGSLGNLSHVNLPPSTDCFDGARIIPYSYPSLDLSVTFGFVSNNPDRIKKAHHHVKTTEWVYVVEGKGEVSLDRRTTLIEAGDWIRIDPGVSHALRNKNPEHMVALCICDPAFDMRDVYPR